MLRIADLFAGAGGETTGIVQALGAVGGKYDLAAVNHWPIAIETHRHNHPSARTYCSSIEQLDPLSVFDVKDKIDLLWASPECTHHSNARGGRPRSDQSRASAWLILKWLSELYVRHVIIENVPEFENWGPLGADGKPIESRQGDIFRAFIEALKGLGYRVDWRLLCAADYGDPTIRTRLFIQAARGRERITWPEPTHSQSKDLFGCAPWVPARNIIDWNINGESIITKKKPLAPATIRRIEAGIKRYWGEWAEPFLVVLHGTGGVRDLSAPLPTVVAGGGHLGIVEPFLVKYYSCGEGTEIIRVPLGTVTTKDRFGLVGGYAGLDITFRMLQPRELANAQGFPDDYWFAGNKSDQVKQIGNAVPVGLARALAMEAISA